MPQLIEELGDVSKEEIQSVAQKVRLDTVYFLRDQSKGGNAV